jgi:hypothetical protein
MVDSAFLTYHARALLCIAQDPGVRLRDIAASLGVTERSAYGIVTELPWPVTSSSRRTAGANRYQIQAHMPLPGPARRERTVGEVLALLADTDARLQPNGAVTRLTARGPTRSRPARGARNRPRARRAAPVRLASGAPYRR